ncbi:hypothetical protein KW805_04635 [Candidatus Pacearchaeota archaeon]|nr:hypothetical protein [Candidatus Pacearchaeota archaeon]
MREHTLGNLVTLINDNRQYDEATLSARASAYTSNSIDSTLFTYTGSMRLRIPGPGKDSQYEMVFKTDTNSGSFPFRVNGKIYDEARGDRRAIIIPTIPKGSVFILENIEDIKF